MTAMRKWRDRLCSLSHASMIVTIKCIHTWLEKAIYICTSYSDFAYCACICNVSEWADTKSHTGEEIIGTHLQVRVESNVNQITTQLAILTKYVLSNEVI